MLLTHRGVVQEYSVFASDPDAFKTVIKCLKHGVEGQVTNCTLLFDLFLLGENVLAPSRRLCALKALSILHNACKRMFVLARAIFVLHSLF
jgi:hypothetical protein